jgi:hypothetical protein
MDGFDKAILHVDEIPGYWFDFRDVTVRDVQQIPHSPDRWAFTLSFGSMTFHHGKPVLTPGDAAALPNARGKAATALAHHMLRLFAPGSAGKK